MKFFIKMLLTGAALMLVTMATNVGTAKAELVTFSTAAQFNGSGGLTTPTSITFGSGADTLTLQFTGVNATVDTSPAGFTFTSFGEIQTIVTGSGATISQGTTLQIQITQTGPSAGTGALAGILSGTVLQNATNGQIVFTITHAEINGITYDITDNPLSLVPPVTNNGRTTIQGRVTAPTAVPEPASMLLLGGGLVGLAAKLRRRKKPRQ